MAKMDDKAKAVVGELMQQLEEDKVNLADEKENLDKRFYDPMLGLKTRVTDYLVNRFDALDQEKDFSRRIREQLLTKLPEAKFSELMTLFNSQKIRETEAVGSLLEFFKPSQGDKVPFIGDTSTEQPKSPEELIHGESSSDMLQAMEKLTQIIATMNPPEDKDS